MKYFVTGAVIGLALFLVAYATGFVAVDVGPFGPSVYVGPLGFHVTADITSWFPGQYI